MADDLSFLSTCYGTDYVHQYDNEITIPKKVLKFKTWFAEFL
jgi:hypothetical protein